MDWKEYFDKKKRESYINGLISFFEKLNKNN